MFLYFVSCVVMLGCRCTPVHQWFHEMHSISVVVDGNVCVYELNDLPSLFHIASRQLCSPYLLGRPLTLEALSRCRDTGFLSLPADLLAAAARGAVAFFGPTVAGQVDLMR